MKNLRNVFLILPALLFVSFGFAQSKEEGKRFLYYERYNSAINTFGKLAQSGSDIEAIYLLGQAHLGKEDVNGARGVYQKAVSANPSAPLLLVGMGHIDLLENRANEARNKFETAISLTKGKDAVVLNAIARANIDARAGDAAYAVDKARQATNVDKRSAEYQVTLGDAYRKMTDGSNAQIAYQAALALDPNHARASYMIGRIYQTQGVGQENLYLQYFNDAIAKDPKFAPVYFWLYDYFYRRDVNKSREFLNKYIGVADTDERSCYLQASILYASSQFQESLTKADECIAAGGAKPYANLFGLKAYAYDKLNDSVNARKWFETYFAKQDTAKLGGGDYSTYGRILLKFPGNEALAANYIEMAVQRDTLEKNKVGYYTDLANAYMAQKNYVGAGRAYGGVMKVKKNPGKLDIYNAGYNLYRGGNYAAADSMFALYVQKYPDEIFGHYMRAKSLWGIDTTMAQGLANPHFMKVIQLAEASPDTAKIIEQLIPSYRYFVAYHYNIRKDKTEALKYVDKILAYKPNDADALNNKKALSAPTRTQGTQGTQGTQSAPKKTTQTGKKASGATNAKPAGRK
jgi:Flp pilus assembly protein TadD